LTKGKKIAGHYTKDDLTVLRNRKRTASLFYETNQTDAIPIFNLLYEWDITKKGVKYISMKKLYMECNDPTEVIFVEKYLIDWNHWVRLQNSKLIGPHIEEWREELSMRIRSSAIQTQIKLAEGGNQNAAKWLATKGWESKPKGKTKKAQAAATLRKTEDKKLDDFMKEDADRLGLSIQ
jgi:hypothetical protein